MVVHHNELPDHGTKNVTAPVAQNAGKRPEYDAPKQTQTQKRVNTENLKVREFGCRCP